MPKVANGRRKRAYGPKSRTGCITCKLRRIKCDETQPACVRCTSSRRVCGGFSIQPPHLPPSNTVRVIVNPPFDIHVHTSPRSKRSFAFFLQRTCPQLAGFFGSVFWDKLVLQAAYHESAIRYIVVAIGSLHESLENQPSVIDSNKTFALEQYSLAVRDLVAPLSQHRKQEIDICLISCVLFTCFENMQGHHISGGSLIRSGAKLLRETLYDQSSRRSQHQVAQSKSYSDFYAPLEVLARIFSGLDLEVAAMIGGQNFNHRGSLFPGIASHDIPSSFSSVEEAKNILENGYCMFINSKATRLSSKSELSLVAAENLIDHYKSLAWKFSAALKVFRESKGPYCTLQEDVAIAVLQLHGLNNYISLHSEYLSPNDWSNWDSLRPEFEEMVVLGEKILSSPLLANERLGKSTSFCLDTGIVIPLYHVASQCQDPIIRRKAISLLRSTSRQEGLWNSFLVADVAERVVDIRETMLSAMDVCTSRPYQVIASAVEPIFELDGRGGRLKYTKQGQGEAAAVHIVEDMFSW